MANTSKSRIWIAFPLSVPSSAFFKEGHVFDPQVGLRDRDVPSWNLTVPFGVQFPKNILARKMDRYDVRCGLDGSSSLWKSHTADSAIWLSIRLKLRVGSGLIAASASPISD
jgi:hypothetical protein